MAEFNREWIESVPSAGRFSDDLTYLRGAERLRARGRDDLDAVWYWTNRLREGAPALFERAQGLRYASRFAVGFIEELGGALGVIVYAEVPAELSSDEVGRLVASSEPSYLVVDDVRFPIFVRLTTTQRHWCTAPGVVSPSFARAACWVRSVPRGVEGWLVPRHAVTHLGQPVTFTDGGSGVVVDHYGECIDAVVVSSNLPPMQRAATQSSWPIVPGQSLLLSDSQHHHVPVTVIDADLNLGVLASMLFPVRFSIDWTGQPGDSGSFIVETHAGEPAGMYLGVLTPALPGYAMPGAGAPISTGYAQSANQLEALSGLEFYP